MQCSVGIISFVFIYHLSVYNEDVIVFWDRCVVWHFTIFLFLIQYLDLHTMQGPSCPSKITLVSIWIRVVLTKTISRVNENSLTLTYIPTQYQHLTDIIIMIPMGRFFNTIMELGYWYHAVTYVPNQNRFNLAIS